MSKKKSAGADSNLAGLDALDAASSQVYDDLLHRLLNTNTLNGLLAAVNDEFKAEVARLPEVAQRALRDAYSVQRDEVKGRMKMEDIAGKPVTITDPPDFPTPTKRKDDGSMSVWCVIKGTIDETAVRFEVRSSAVRVVKHFEGAALTSYPQHVTFYQESAAAMLARNAAKDSSPMWLVKREATPRERNDGIPF